MKPFRLVLSLLLTIAVVACSGPATTLPRTATPVQQAQTATAPSAQVTSTAMPTAVPGPELVKATPAPGQEMALNGHVTLVFSQDMDRASVQEALLIQPDTPLAFAWQDDRTLTVSAEAGAFASDTEYTFALSRSAKSASGTPLSRPRQWVVATTGVATVAQMVPMPDSTDVAVSSPLRVVFDRPVVPLVGVAEQSKLPSPVTISPTTEGTGAWVNTSIYEFAPTGGWRGGTRYTVKTVASPGDPIVATIGDAEWSFVAALPRITGVAPSSDEPYADPATTISLTFNQPMAQAETEKLLSVRNAARDKVEGTLSWQDATLVFKPASPLDRGERISVELAQGAPAASGEAAIEAPYRASFRVAPALAFSGSTPRSGARNVAYDEPISLSFTCPIDVESLRESLKVDPEVDLGLWTDETGTTAQAWLSLKPSTTYTITIDKGMKDLYGGTLGKEVTISFTTRPRTPSVWLRTPNTLGLYDAHAEPFVYASAVNVNSVTFELFDIGQDGFIALARDGGWPNWDAYNPPKDGLLRRWTTKIDAKQNEITNVKVALGGEAKALASGYYVLRVTSAGTDVREYHLIIVTPYSLVLKTTTSQAVLWATDLKTGLPVSDLDLTLYGQSGQPFATTTTDKDGIATAKLADGDPWSPITVVGTLGDDTTAVLRNWSDGISPWAFDLPVEQYPQPFRVYSFSDRSIYRPGQTVYYKGFVRADDDGTYSLPVTGLPVRVEVRDSQGRTIARDQLALSETGSFDGAVLLSESASLGYYYATFGIDDQYADLSFLVAEYRKPEFQGAMTFDRSAYVQGDVAKAEASVSYFFGGPVKGGRVLWNTIKEAYTPYWPELSQYTFGDEELSAYPRIGDQGAVSTSGETVTDDQGAFALELPVDLSEDQGSCQLVLEATVIDANNQEITLTAKAALHKGAIYAGLGTDNYVGTVDDEMGVNLITVDTQGKPIGKTTVEVTFLKHEWYSVKEVSSEGLSYWTNKTKETKVSSVTVTTDAKGLAQATFKPPEGGSYRVRTTVRDAKGNESHCSLYVWVTSDEFINWGQQNDNLLKLVADRDEYSVGDVARIMVPVPFDAPALALVTIERGSVIEHSLVKFDGVTKIIEVPIKDAYVPDVFFGVTMMYGSDAMRSPATFKMGYVQLHIDTSSRQLDVRIKPAKTTYKPRDEAEYVITTLDSNGKPVSAEVTLRLVDLAVETLVGAEETSILDAFYRERGLGVSTAAGLTVSVDRVNYEYSQQGKGGGGGDGGGGAAAREYFPDTAYWQATLVTNEQGKASVTVLLPDNLTTWRMKAQAMSVDNLVGSATADVVTNLDLMVRPALPRFFAAGDEPELSAVVHNNTRHGLTVDVSLEADQVEISSSKQQVKIAAGDKATVTWKARVTGIEQASLSIKATSGELSDAVKVSIPIVRPTSPEVVGTSGQVDGRITEYVQVPLLADPDWGAMVVLLEPSLAAGMTQGLDYLEHYPYECAEQTISRFYPNVVTYRALKELGVARQGQEASLKQQVGVGLQRLYELQNPDGGWGWWAHQESNPTLTAYAVIAMATARDADFAVDENSLGQALGFLQAKLDEKEIDARYDRDQRAAILYALAVSGNGDLGRSVRLYDQRDGVSLYSKAYLAMTLALLDTPDSERVKTIANELEQAAIMSATGAHWEEAEASPWSMNTDTRTSAMVLRALVQVSPHSATLPEAVRWLMTARSAGRWETTQENVWAIVALTDYMVSTGELKGQYDYGVSLNGDTLEKGTIDPKTTDQVMVQQVALSDLQSEAPNALELTRSDGPGKLYYSAYLNYYLPVDSLYPLARGVYVQREYTYLDAAGKPAERAVLNGLVRVKLTVIAPHDLYYLVIEDALPAGCEAIDPALDISRRVDESAGLAPVGEPPTEEPFWRQSWPTHTEFRDEKVALFAAELGRGTYEYTYTMRCSAAGLYNVLPALAYEMYAPDVMGRSAGEQLLIER